MYFGRLLEELVVDVDAWDHQNDGILYLQGSHNARRFGRQAAIM